MKPQDFAMLQEMQQLCTEVEQDVEKIAAFTQHLEAAHRRYQALSALYHNHWQRLTETEAISDTQKQQIESMVAAGSYSVFGQDTVWNALSDLHLEYIKLLKTLAQKI